ncbi:hypothetical protein RHSIM_Rhsim02G0148600 [Rhododendron simsii]|uniref:Uncharacterized protein n=1 Tax=Rhododendron simsii TaxID=118357 RepID=A0A834LX99_RHOSS|nr:hypothetical protein RHSIM_Rhsim02G0148600 [Rhododendron simsii]
MPSSPADRTDRQKSPISLITGISFISGRSRLESIASAISNAYATTYGLYNPQFENAGKFMVLRDFMALDDNTSSVSGVLIVIEVS